MYLLRAKQIGLTMDELEQMEEGMAVDLMTESGNDLCGDEYRQTATQGDMDQF